MQDYKKLKVWSESHNLVLDIYKITKTFPDEEKFSLVSQSRRAASSIPTNIVEGTGRQSRKALINFLYYAVGSAKEVEYLLFLSKELRYLSEESFNAIDSKLSKIRRMLFSLIKTLNTQPQTSKHKK